MQAGRPQTRSVGWVCLCHLWGQVGPVAVERASTDGSVVSSGTRQLERIADMDAWQVGGKEPVQDGGRAYGCTLTRQSVGLSVRIKHGHLDALSWARVVGILCVLPGTSISAVSSTSPIMSKRIIASTDVCAPCNKGPPARPELSRCSKCRLAMYCVSRTRRP